MNSAQKRTRLVVFLGLLAVAQILLLLLVANRRQARGDFVAVGSVLGGIEVVGALGPRTLVPAGTEDLQVLLVFSATCPHCETVAADWKEWTADPPPSVGLLAVTGDALETGQAFGEEHGWSMSVAAAPASHRPSAADDLLKRTPWLFLLDGQGEVLFEGHGERLAALDSAIAVHQQSFVPQPRSP